MSSLQLSARKATHFSHTPLHTLSATCPGFIINEYVNADGKTEDGEDFSITFEVWTVVCVGGLQWIYRIMVVCAADWFLLHGRELCTQRCSKYLGTARNCVSALGFLQGLLSMAREPVCNGNGDNGCVRFLCQRAHVLVDHWHPQGIPFYYLYYVCLHVRWHWAFLCYNHARYDERRCGEK